MNFKRVLFISALISILILQEYDDLYSQNYDQIIKGKGVQVIVKGKISDEFTGKPVTCTIEMKTQSGKRIKTNSNSIDGYFEQVLNAGESYEFSFSGYDIVKKIQNIQLDNVDKTVEKTMNFSVRRLTEGVQLYALNGFDKGTTRLNWAGNAAMKELEEILKFNRGAKFEFVVSSKDSYSSVVKTEDPKDKKSKKEKKSKKKSKSVNTEDTGTESVSENSEEILKGKKLIDARIEAMKEVTKDWVRFKDRISYNPDYKSKEGKFNLIIKVTEIKNLFE